MGKIVNKIEDNINDLLEKARDIFKKDEKISPEVLAQELEVGVEAAIKLLEILEKEGGL